MSLKNSASSSSSESSPPPPPPPPLSLAKSWTPPKTKARFEFATVTETGRLLFPCGNNSNMFSLKDFSESDPLNIPSILSQTLDKWQLSKYSGNTMKTRTYQQDDSNDTPPPFCEFQVGLYCLRLKVYPNPPWWISRLKLYTLTRGPWTATPALSKINKKHEKNIYNSCNILVNGTVFLYTCQNRSQQGPFLKPHHS